MSCKKILKYLHSTKISTKNFQIQQFFLLQSLRLLWIASLWPYPPFCTVIVVDVTVDATVARFTGTGVGVDIVITHRSMLTWVGGTLVNVVLAVVATKPRRTNTGVVGDLIIACSPVLTGRGLTVIDVGLAETTCVASGTHALVRAIRVDTGTLRMTQSVLAFVIVFTAVATYRSKVKHYQMVKAYFMIVRNFLYTDPWSDYKRVNLPVSP